MLMAIVMVMASIVRVYKIREENANPGKGQSFQTQDELPCSAKALGTATRKVDRMAPVLYP